jgi:hypothetical protein
MGLGRDAGWHTAQVVAEQLSQVCLAFLQHALHHNFYNALSSAYTTGLQEITPGVIEL